MISGDDERTLDLRDMVDLLVVYSSDFLPIAASGVKSVGQDRSVRPGGEAAKQLFGEFFIITVDSCEGRAVGDFNIVRRNGDTLPRHIDCRGQIVKRVISDDDIATECGVLRLDHPFARACLVPSIAQEHDRCGDPLAVPWTEPVRALECRAPQDLVEISLRRELSSVTIVGMVRNCGMGRLPPFRHQSAVAQNVDTTDGDRRRFLQFVWDNIEWLRDAWFKAGGLHKIAGETLVRRIGFERVLSPGQKLLPFSLQQKRKGFVRDRLRFRRRMIVSLGEKMHGPLVLAQRKQT